MLPCLQQLNTSISGSPAHLVILEDYTVSAGASLLRAQSPKPGLLLRMAGGSRHVDARRNAIVFGSGYAAYRERVSVHDAGAEGASHASWHRIVASI